jgi:KDO2-lipid IV(A) lauroyltransferase
LSAAPLDDGPATPAVAPSALWRRYWSPRYWPTWLLAGWMWITAQLPWRATIGLHAFLGRALSFLLVKQKRTVRRNLEICFPALPEAEVARLIRQHFENISACLAEMALGWFGNPRRRAQLFDIAGEEHLQAALAKGHGIILLSGHFTPIEICVPVVKTLVPLFAFMYRPRRNALMNELQSLGRHKAAHVTFANDDVRGMVRALRTNGTVWYAPDQASRARSAELLPFFGEPAMTSTALSRVAKASGAAVVPFFFRRRRDGYSLRFEPALADFPTADVVADTIRVFGIIERFVRECPEQYMWNHRKFKGRAAHLPDAYGDREGS